MPIPPGGSIFDEDGALSREYLVSRGSCCKSNCKNCPYETEDASETPEAKTFISKSSGQSVVRVRRDADEIRDKTKTPFTKATIHKIGSDDG